MIDQSSADVPQPQDNGVLSGFSDTSCCVLMNGTNHQGAAVTEIFDLDSDIVEVLGNNCGAT
eukprot:8437374-Ditylum_brightwellii.AAC.1